MKVEIKVPALGESVTEAIVSSIIKPSGSLVQKDDEIIELETDKVNQVLYASDAGKLSLTVHLDGVVTVGQVIGTIDTSAKVEGAAPPPKPEAPTPSAAPVRKKEDEFISELTEEKKPATRPEPKEGEVRTRMSGLRRTIAQKLVEAKNQTAMLTTFNEIDMTAIIGVRTKEKENFEKKFGVRLGFMSFFVKGVVAALKAIPEINSYIDKDEIVTLSTYDVGIAVSTDKGLMVPVIRNCDALSYAEIESKIKEYATKARERTISLDDLRGGSFTITNGGIFGSLLSTPLINFPQSAILGMHAIVKRPIAINDEIEIRPMMYTALSYDHRLIDGKQAIEFLVHLKENLEDPTRFLLEL